MSWATPATSAELRSQVVLAAPSTERVEAWYKALARDPRWQVAGVAKNLAELQTHLSSVSNLLVIDGLLFDSAQALRQSLSQSGNPSVVLLPTTSTEAEANLVSETPGVRRVFRNEDALADVLAELSPAQQLPEPAPPAPVAPPSSEVSLSGLRVIAVWNLVGGAGKTTIATCLALEARRRGLKTLLVGLGAPDDTAVVLPRLKAQPNLTHWESNPTAAGLAAAVQNVEGLDVLPGYPDALALAHGETEAHSQLSELVLTAAYAGYGAIILDAPALERAAPVLASANQLLLVARPTLGDALRTVNAYRLVTEKLKGQHRLAPQAVRLVLNQTRPGLWSPRQFQEACLSLLPKASPFPAALAALPDDARVPEAQNRRQWPLSAAPEFQQAFGAVADGCLPGRAGSRLASAPDSAGPKTLFRLGPVKVKG